LPDAAHGPLAALRTISIGASIWTTSTSPPTPWPRLAKGSPRSRGSLSTSRRPRSWRTGSRTARAVPAFGPFRAEKGRRPGERRHRPPPPLGHAFLNSRKSSVPRGELLHLILTTIHERAKNQRKSEDAASCLPAGIYATRSDVTSFRQTLCANTRTHRVFSSFADSCILMDPGEIRFFRISRRSRRGLNFKIHAALTVAPGERQARCGHRANASRSQSARLNCLLVPSQA
jgi:hypothetical protein